MTLKEKCKEHGYTFKDVSEKTKISQAYLSKLNTGVKKNPSRKILTKIANLLKMTLDELDEVLKN